MEDRERVGRVVRRCDQEIAFVGLQDGGVAIARGGARAQILQDQRPPVRLRLVHQNRILLDLGRSRLEVARQLAVEDRVMAVLAGRDAIALGHAAMADGEAGRDPLGDGFDCERLGGWHSRPIDASTALQKPENEDKYDKWPKPFLPLRVRSPRPLLASSPVHGSR
jgi:hypothetical protein